MKFQYFRASSLGILASTSIFWSLLLCPVSGCSVDSNCLPLRARLANYSYTEAYVNAGETVTITCHTDCRNLNLNGCNVTDDWIAITTDASGTIRTYQRIKHDKRNFGIDSGINSLNFSRSINQSGICNGSQADEQFNATIGIGDNPSFSTILISCGLGRFGSNGFEPIFVAHDFTAVFKIHLNQPDVQISISEPVVSTRATSTVSAKVITANTEDNSMGSSDDTTAVSGNQVNMPETQQNETTVIISLSIVLMIVITIAVISVIGIILVARKYISKRTHPQREQADQGIAMNTPYYNHNCYPIEAFQCS